METAVSVATAKTGRALSARGAVLGMGVSWDEAIWTKDHLGKGSPGEGAACQRDQPVWYREDRSSMEDSPNSLLKENLRTQVPRASALRRDP
jgi:hypothetical protein